MSRETSYHQSTQDISLDPSIEVEVQVGTKTIISATTNSNSIASKPAVNMAATTTITPMLDATLVHQVRSSAAEKAIATSKLSGEIRVVEPEEYKEAAACLAEAFREDKVVRYAVDTPDRMHLTEEERYEMHKQAMEYVTYAHCLNGLVLTVGDNFDCVALWLPPGKNIDDWITILRSGMWRMQFSLSTEGKERFFNEFLPLLSKSKAEVLGDRDHHSWYLNYIGTKASARGKGYARKLIEHVTRLVISTSLRFVHHPDMVPGRRRRVTMLSRKLSRHQFDHLRKDGIRAQEADLPPASCGQLSPGCHGQRA